MTGEARPGSYEEQARTYDLTRGASPTVVRLVTRFLGEARGRMLLDVAGGTGNYARALRARGFDVVVLDAQPAMLSRSVPKIGAGRQVVGDAVRLPLRDGAVDCAMLVSAIHLMGSPGRVLREIRRVIREGPFVLQAFSLENLQPLFITDYFPGFDPLAGEHLLAEDIQRAIGEAGFDRVERETFVYLDTVDGSLPALHTDAHRLAGPAYLRNTSFYHRFPPDILREGLARLATDLRTGVLEDKVRASLREAASSGHGTVFAAWP